MDRLRKSRYRREGDQPCIDIAVESVDQLFDNRDPAPFRDRDLQPAVVEYLSESGDDLVRAERLRVVFWLRKEPAVPVDLEAPYRAFFEDALTRLERRSGHRVRLGLTTLVIAATSIVLIFGLTQALSTVLMSTVGKALVEGLNILSWVILWRPADVLLYDWIPIRRKRRVLRLLLDADLQLRNGVPPEGG